MEPQEIANELMEITKLANTWIHDESKQKTLADDLKQAGLDHIQKTADYKKNKLIAILNEDK
jgi:hypothetical protein